MLPRKLKNMNVFNDGFSYLGESKEASLPKLGRKFEDYRGGGMDGDVKIDLGQQALEMEWTCGGFVAQVVSQFGATSADAVQLRFMGAYQADDDGAVSAVEVVVRGRHEEIDMGTAKPGEDTEHKIKTACSYYKLTVDGVTMVEIDLLGFVFIVDGVDRLAEQRAAIGLA